MNPASTFPPPPVGPTEGSSGDLWFVGAIVNVIGSIAINLGTNLMKLGHNKRARLDMPDAEKPPVRKFKEWVIGMSFFSVGNILNFVSFGFAAQSLLAALGSIQFVSNVVFAYFVLHEPINRMILVATACIVGGCILLVVFGNQSSATYTVKQLIDLYTKPAYVVYLSLLCVGVVAGYILYHQGQKVVSKTGPRGFWYGLLPVAYSVFSALIGTQSVLFSKSMSVILRLTFTGDNQLDSWYTWLVLPLFLLTAVFWITRLNKGLRMFPAMIIVPVMQISWTLFSIVSGMLYFQEYLGFTPLKSVMFPIGVLVVFIGVFALTQSGSSRPTSYHKMEEASAAKALKQDAAGTAVGSHDTIDFSLPQRRDSVDTTRPPESVAVTVEELAVTAGRQGPRAEEPGRGAQPQPAASPLKGSEATDEGDRAAQPPSPLKSEGSEDGTGKPLDRQSMLDSVKKRIRNVQGRLNRELLGMETKAGFRLAMGLGDGDIPAISLFAMPSLLDYAAAGKVPGQYLDSALASPTEDDSIAYPLRPIVEEPETDKVAGSPLQLAEGRSALEQQTSQTPPPPPPPEGSPLPTRPSTAPASPRHSGLGRTLIDRAERAAKTGIEAIKRAPSNLQRVVREKQGYGSLYDDEEKGLLEMTEPSGVGTTSKQR